MGKIPDAYDPIFAEVSTHFNLPANFLKALAWNESRFKADATPIGADGKAASSAVGFFQTLKATVDFYNASSGTTVPMTMEDMKDPGKSAMVGAWLITKILQAYKGSGVSALAPDWTNPVFAGLVALGYVAGWSNEQGVAHLAPYVARQGAPVTPANVAKAAMMAYPKGTIYSDGHGYMSDPALLKHVQNIAHDYATLEGLSGTSPAPGGGSAGKSGLIALAAIGLGLFVAKGRG